MSKFFEIIALLFIITAFAGCSGNGIVLEIPKHDVPPISDSMPTLAETQGHTPLGFWEADFDVDNMTCAVTTSRELNAHFNVTSLVPTPGIRIISYDPTSKILTVDVTINNPYTISGYDVRLILFFYRTDSLFLTNDDDWTTLYDISGGYPYNPFKAYAKSVPNRKFNAQTQLTERLLIYYLSGSPPARFAIDASYPSNCAEPYSMENFTQGTLGSWTGASAELKVDVYDWQNDVNAVNITIPEITGDEFTPFSFYGGTEWRATITNNMGAPAGTYYAPLWAASSGSGTLVLYEVEKIIVTRVITWPATWGDTSSDYGYAVETDSNGYVYVGGGFQGAVDFDPGEGIVWGYSSGGSDAFLSKLSSDGNLLWVKVWGHWEGNEAVQGIAFDNSGNIYTTGYFNGAVDFDPGNGTEYHTSNGYEDIFISKFNSQGDHQWAQTWGNQYNYDRGLAVATDGYDSIYTVGYFFGDTDFDPGNGTDIHSAHGAYRDAFISKFNSSGVYQWAGTWGSTDWDEAGSVAVDGSGNAYVDGYFRLTVDFDPDPATTVEYPSNGGKDVYLSKFNPSGDLQWARTWGGTSEETAGGIDIFANIRIYVPGSFMGTADFDPGDDTYNLISGAGVNGFLTAFDPDGEHIHAVGYGGDGNVTATDIVCTNNYIYTCGFFSGTADFDPGPGLDTRTASSSNFDAYVCKYTYQHLYQWVGAWGSGPADEALSVAYDSQDNVYVTGYFQGITDFDPGTGVVNRTSKGSSDVFVNKLDKNGNIVTQP